MNILHKTFDNMALINQKLNVFFLFKFLLIYIKITPEVVGKI